MRPLLVLSYDYPPNSGGISRLCSSVVDEIASRQREIRVLTVRSDTSAGPPRPTIPTIDVPRVRGGREIATTLNLLRTPRETIVISGVWNPEGSLAYMNGKHPTVILAHGNEVMAYPDTPIHRAKGRLRERVFEAAGAVICNSRYTEGLVLDIMPSAHTHVINPAVDIADFLLDEESSECRRRFSLSEDKFVLLSVSRLAANKGHDLVLRALARLVPDVRKRLHYAICGTGDAERGIRALAAELGLTEHVSFLGFVADEELPYLYNAADLFVLCTKEDPDMRAVEGFGIVFLEAQAAGVPVIGTCAGGIPDAIVEGEGGWLIAPDDTKGLTVHFDRLVRDSDFYKREGRRGQRRIEGLGSWSQYVDHLLHVVDSLGN